MPAVATSDEPLDVQTFLIYGDLGVDVGQNQSVPYLQKEVTENQIDMILHVGDIAYSTQTLSFLNQLFR